MPFLAANDDGPARVLLEQLPAGRFRLLEGFRYEHPDGRRSFRVEPQVLDQTDLTSVPFMFRWFVNTYGPHTLPALLHDCLIDADKAALALVDGALGPPTRLEADDVFLTSLGEQDVPFVRRHLMWSSVVFQTRRKHSGPGPRAAMYVWIVAAFAGTALTWWSATTRPLQLLPLLAGVLGPLPFALLWGRSARAAAWFGYGVVLLLPAGVVVLLSYGVYALCEWLLRPFTRSAPPPGVRRF